MTSPKKSDEKSGILCVYGRNHSWELGQGTNSADSNGQTKDRIANKLRQTKTGYIKTNKHKANTNIHLFRRFV